MDWKLNLRINNIVNAVGHISYNLYTVLPCSISIEMQYFRNYAMQIESIEERYFS